MAAKFVVRITRNVQVQPESDNIIFSAYATLIVEEENKIDRDIQPGVFLSSTSQEGLEGKIDDMKKKYKDLIDTSSDYLMQIGKVEEVRFG